ncbi:DinB family protein [Flavobacterium soli]|uniref:DinB family protein n=1 Tax=Flavobacterium soli TaxID=344881 RepID=UPI00041A599A|nr:DinB family protein [Flavobacterium soli]
MEEKLEEFGLLLNRFQVLYSTNSIADFEIKLSENKWSKKEILGHLIDSAINNIQRFTEIQTFEKPYKIRTYSPDDLVKSNDYQNKNNQELLDLWISLNVHALHIIKNQTEKTLAYKLILPNGEESDLKFLIEDYFEHLYYHLKQIDPTWI